MSRPYQELKHRSEFSLGVATGRLEEHAERAAELGMPALALAEGGSMRGAFAVHEESQKKGLRPIFGVEVNVVADHARKGLTPDEEAVALDDAEGARGRRRALARAERRLGLDRSWGLTLRAATDQGVLNLSRLTSRSWIDGFWKKPRVDLGLVAEHADGLVATVGGEGLADALAQGTKAALGVLSRLDDLFPGRLFLELQPHAGNHRELNRAIYLLGEHLGIPRIAVNDVRYVRHDDVDAHTVVLCLARRNPTPTLETPGHPQSLPGYHLRSGDEVFEAFRVTHPDLPASEVEAAIERTLEVVDLCHGKLDVNPHKGLVPDVGLGDPMRALISLCREGWTWRDIPGRAKRRGVSFEDYSRQLRHELEVVKNTGFAAYFLYVRDVIQFCRREGIMVGPGRGSAAGALVCYLLGITSIDPLEHGLMFERFLAPGRVDLPDVDTDFDQGRREEVIRYIRERYGEDRTAHIATYGRMHGKGALKDVCRILGIHHATVNALTATFPNKQGDEKRPVREVLEGSAPGRGFLESHPDVLRLVERLEGTIRQIGVHAAGVVAAPVSLPEVCPVEVHPRAVDGVKMPTRVTALDMWGVGALGVLKLDVLGLANLSVLRAARSAILDRHGEAIDFEALTFDDQDVIDAFSRQEFAGIFQYDATSARATCEGLEFAGFADVAALTALNRPGPARSGLTEKFRTRRQDPDKIDPVHPVYDRITDDTLGVLVYQEQVVRIFRELAGFSAEEADKMRKIMGKKLGAEEMEKYRAKFLDGVAVTLPDFRPEVADDIFDQLTKFAEYAFNRAHSVSYAAVAYWEMWAKVRYPVEFVWALMACAKDSDEALSYTHEAKRLSVEVLPAEVGTSGAHWTLVGESTIRAGLRDIAGVGKKAIAYIVTAQEAAQFRDVVDFLERVPGRAVNAKVLVSLVKSGAMRHLLPNTKWALENLNAWVGRRGKRGWQDEVRAAVEGSRALPDYSDEDLLALALSVCPQGSGRHPTELYRPLFEGDGVLAGREWVPLDDDAWWTRSSAWVYGVISELKFRQVGDFGSEPETEEEKKRKQWGRRYAQVLIQDASGVARKVKVEPDVLDRFGAVLELGKGAAVAMHLVLLQKFHSIRADVIVDLEGVRQKTNRGIPLGFWERCLTSEHPVLQFSRKSFTRPRGRKWIAVGLVTNLRVTVDRNGNDMAFFGLQDGHGNHLEVVAFSSVWDAHSDAVVVGRVVDAAVKLDRRSVVLDEDGILNSRVPASG